MVELGKKVEPERTTSEFNLSYVGELEAHINAGGTYKNNVILGLIKMVRDATGPNKNEIWGFYEEGINNDKTN